MTPRPSIPFHLRLILALLLLAAPLGAQRVELRIAGKAAPDSVQLFTYDTLLSVEAVAVDSRGRKAPSAKPQLDFHMWTVAKLVQNTRSKGNIVGVGQGTAFAVATWVRSDGRVFTDTLWIGVPRPRVMELAVCFDFTPVETDVGFVRRCVPAATVTVGESRCVYVTAKDRRGAFITGLDPQLQVGNPQVAALSSSFACPDTTVDPYKLTYPITRPPR